eukprot:TRINITY_DN50045_c0_g1_i1.p1 TRINITY_DN50045_c0_g1~~TRINITY_DN50045_c0_g1_i1.p1  ORF type:complete len:388 (+),score=45.35 TRINITY_DN50045_c0_g1_i1:101-1264(+)
MAGLTTNAPTALSRLNTETGSATGATSRNTMSTCSDDGYNFGGVTLNLDDTNRPETIESVLARLEDLQFQQRSPQQPNPELDAALSQAFAVRPEWRTRMAVLTKSSWLRKKILSAEVGTVRSCGSGGLGSTHSWRQGRFLQESSPNTVPKGAMNMTAGSQLMSATEKHRIMSKTPAEKLRYDPVLSHSPNYSMSKASRFPGTVDGTGVLNKAMLQKKSTPGPGTYFKTVPRGVAFTEDGGETTVFGANHTCPWKGSLGHQINPVDADQTVLTSQPKWSFSKARRAISETSLGHAFQDGGPVKTDFGCLSPGHVYEQYSSFRASSRPSPSGTMRSSRSTPASRNKEKRVRCVRVELTPLEQEVLESGSQVTGTSGSKQPPTRRLSYEY